ncbi:restriction endonuclease subunit S [Enterococcus faecium]|uniref:restriction endonuclease subunit S n=1 Tax=Enterococcus faecium TaxID=1352 RepID=UPI0034E951B3
MSNDKQPEIRFPGFAEDWKQRKLIEGVSKIGDGLHGTPSYSEDGDVFFINGNNLVNGKISITKETKFVNESDQSKDDKSLNVNTILMSINGTIGNLAWYNNEKVMLGKSIAYLTVSDFDKNFVYFYLQTPMMRKYFISNLTGTTIKNLGLKTIRNTELFVADLDEQQKIGSFFKQLDDTIALHQRKLDLLKETKKGFLQKMFPKNGAKVPEIRFPGFTEDWEQRRLGDVLTVSKEKNKSNSYSKEQILSVSREVGTVNQIEYQGRSFAGADISGYKIVYPGQLIYTKSPLKGAPYGIFQLVTEEGIVSPLYAVYNSTEQALASFIGLQLKSDNIATHYLSPLVSKGAKNTINITDEGALDGRVTYPTITEQQKIVAFFKQLENTITLHQRKLDLLKETKKGFLQKMFV